MKEIRMYARLSPARRKLLRVVTVASLHLIPIAASAAPEEPVAGTMADACQHESHWHYHFPYAHYDYWEYHGHWTEFNGQHFHKYWNQQHNYWEYKDCSGAG